MSYSEEITKKAAAKTQERAATLFEGGTLVSETPYTSRPGVSGLFPAPRLELNLEPGLYVMRAKSPDQLFLVYTVGEITRATVVTADVNGKLYTHWYSEVSRPYSPVSVLAAQGTILKRCDDNEWRTVLADHDADNQAMEERWANS